MSILRSKRVGSVYRLSLSLASGVLARSSSLTYVGLNFALAVFIADERLLSEFLFQSTVNALKFNQAPSTSDHQIGDRLRYVILSASICSSLMHIIPHALMIPPLQVVVWNGSGSLNHQRVDAADPLRREVLVAPGASFAIQNTGRDSQPLEAKSAHSVTKSSPDRPLVLYLFFPLRFDQALES